MPSGRRNKNGANPFKLEPIVASCSNSEVKQRKCEDIFRDYFAWMTFLIFSFVPAQAQPSHLRNLTFTNLEGRVYSNINVLKVETDGIMFRYGEEFRYDRVKFTNMAEAVQVQFGYDLKKIAREGEIRKEQQTKAREEIRQKATLAAAEREAKRGRTLRDATERIYPLSFSDFPKDTNAVRVCRQAAYELKGLQTAIDLGVTYQKYNDLITDTAITVGKIKDNNQGLFPARFDAEMNLTLYHFTTAREWWKRSLDTDYTKVECEHLLQKNWKQATLSLTYCLAMAEQRTNIIDSITQQVAELLVSEELASRKRINLGAEPDPIFEGLGNSEIIALFREYLKTNSPVANQINPK
jgi:hypothetical protein